MTRSPSKPKRPQPSIVWNPRAGAKSRPEITAKLDNADVEKLRDANMADKKGDEHINITGKEATVAACVTADTKCGKKNEPITIHRPSEVTHRQHHDDGKVTTASQHAARAFLSSINNSVNTFAGGNVEASSNTALVTPPPPPPQIMVGPGQVAMTRYGDHCAPHLAPFQQYQAAQCLPMIHPGYAPMQLPMMAMQQQPPRIMQSPPQVQQQLYCQSEQGQKRKKCNQQDQGQEKQQEKKTTLSASTIGRNVYNGKKQKQQKQKNNKNALTASTIRSEQLMSENKRSYTSLSYKQRHEQKLHRLLTGARRIRQQMQMQQQMKQQQQQPKAIPSHQWQLQGRLQQQLEFGQQILQQQQKKKQIVNNPSQTHAPLNQFNSGVNSLAILPEEGREPYTTALANNHFTILDIAITAIENGKVTRTHL